MQLKQGNIYKEQQQQNVSLTLSGEKILWKKILTKSIKNKVQGKRGQFLKTHSM